MSGPTPGPWVAIQKLGGFAVIAQVPGSAIVWSDASWGLAIEEAEANIRLCAASHDLLDSLRVLMQLIELNDTTRPYVEGARQAIAKATGEDHGRRGEL